MIIDTFMFNDEFEMLDLRLELSKNYVDKWIVLEGNKTWSGKEKPFHLKNNFEKYSKLYNKKIDLICLEIPNGYKDWQCENFSRASLQQGINQYDDNDIIIHSDLDEILNPILISEIVQQVKKENKPVSCTLDMFIYKFDQKVERKWNGNVVAKKYMFTDPQHLYKGNSSKRKNRELCTIFPKIAGWHWTWIGDDERIKNKVVSCIESQHRDPDQVLNALKQQDTQAAINHKCKTTRVEVDYPVEVLQIIKKLPYWS